MLRPLVPARAENLGKDFREGFRGTRRTAVKSVSFSVPEGSVYGLLGPNGAGKSTTLHMLLGFLQPSRGFVALFDRTPRDPESRRDVGFLPEVFAFDHFSTGRTLLARFDRLSGRDAGGRTSRVEQALRAVGLENDAGRRIGSYSKGMAQRIGVAQAILGDPELVILDEPMSGMDAETRQSVKKLIEARRERGRTTVFSTHILADAEDLVDHMLILGRGKAIYEGPLSKLIQPLPGSRVVLRTTDEGRLRAMLAELGLQEPSASLADGSLAVNVPDDDRLQALLAQTLARGITVISMNPLRQSLEAVFLELTDSRNGGGTDAR